MFRRHLDAGDAHEPVVGGQLGGRQRRVHHVVVGDDDRVETDVRRLLEDELDGVVPVVRGAGVDMWVDADGQ